MGRRGSLLCQHRGVKEGLKAQASSTIRVTEPLEIRKHKKEKQAKSSQHKKR